MSWFWLDQLDKEFEDVREYRRKIEQLEDDYHRLAAANASNIVKAQNVFRCLKHIEFMVIKCPTCGAKRDDDGILAHRKKCYLCDTLRNANDE